jgi:hypothetical protein
MCSKFTTFRINPPTITAIRRLSDAFFQNIITSDFSFRISLSDIISEFLRFFVCYIFVDFVSSILYEVSQQYEAFV